jgi:hypothetical protein
MEFVLENESAQDDAAVLELLAGDLEPFYMPRLPYHNWDEHIQGGMIALEGICQQDVLEGKPINSLMAKVAYLGHDAGFGHDLLEPDVWEPYGSKEGYSAHIMGALLKSYGFDETFIGGVQTCIMFTKMDEKLPSGADEELANTAQAVRTADLYNVFGTYRGFITNSFKLMEEDRLYGRERSLREFKNISKFVLGNFLSADFTPSGKCTTAEGIKNIDRFVKDSPSHLLRALGKQASRFAGLLGKKAA